MSFISLLQAVYNIASALKRFQDCCQCLSWRIAPRMIRFGTTWRVVYDAMNNLALKVHSRCIATERTLQTKAMTVASEL